MRVTGKIALYDKELLSSMIAVLIYVCASLFLIEFQFFKIRTSLSGKAHESLPFIPHNLLFTAQ
jgi:hypothetical protein